MSEDFLDQMIARRTERDGDFPRKLGAARKKRAGQLRRAVSDAPTEGESSAPHLGQSRRSESE